MKFFIVGNSINLMKEDSDKRSWRTVTPSNVDLINAYPVDSDTVEIFKTEKEAVAYASSKAERKFPAQEFRRPIFEVEYIGSEKDLDWKTRKVDFDYSYPEKNQHPLAGTVFIPNIKYVEESYSATINYCEVLSKQLKMKGGVLREIGPLENSGIICEYSPYQNQCILF